MNAETMTLCDVVMKLVGPIHPIGESNEDERRFENLKILAELLDYLKCEILSVACNCEHRHEASMQKAGKFARRAVQLLEGIRPE